MNVLGDHYSACRSQGKHSEVCEGPFYLGTEEGTEASVEWLMGREPDYKSPYIQYSLLIRGQSGPSQKTWCGVDVSLPLTPRICGSAHPVGFSIF